MYEAVNSGNLERTKNIIEKLQDSLQHEYSTNQESVEKCKISYSSTEDNSEIECSQGINNKQDVSEFTEDILNQSFGSYNETVLHLSSRLGHADIVKTILEAGGNPAVK